MLYFTVSSFLCFHMPKDQEVITASKEGVFSMNNVSFSQILMVVNENAQEWTTLTAKQIWIEKKLEKMNKIEFCVEMVQGLGWNHITTLRTQTHYNELLQDNA